MTLHINLPADGKENALLSKNSVRHTHLLQVVSFLLSMVSMGTGRNVSQWVDPHISCLPNFSFKLTPTGGIVPTLIKYLAFKTVTYWKFKSQLCLVQDNNDKYA